MGGRARCERRQAIGGRQCSFGGILAVWRSLRNQPIDIRLDVLCWLDVFLLRTAFVFLIHFMAPVPLFSPVILQASAMTGDTACFLFYGRVLALVFVRPSARSATQQRATATHTAMGVYPNTRTLAALLYARYLPDVCYESCLSTAVSMDPCCP